MNPDKESSITKTFLIKKKISSYNWKRKYKTWKKDLEDQMQENLSLKITLLL